MKTYFRLLSFAKPIEKFAIPYIIATTLAIFFNTFNFALLSPLLTTLFPTPEITQSIGAVTKPASFFDFLGKFREYVSYAKDNYGEMGTLKIV